MTTIKYSDERVLDDWCEAEMRYWTDIYSGPRTFAEELERLNDSVATIFIIDIMGQSVNIRLKPRFHLRRGSPDGNSQEAQRARLYRSYLETCLRLSNISLTTSFALDVHDLPLHHSSAPIFCFQKQAASRNILLPDVDFMQNLWYLESFDELSFAAKLSAAIFVGSSTGGGLLTSHKIVLASSPRLAFARDLIGNPRICFLIGAAVQCDGPETEALLRNQPYFSSPVAWSEQLKSKFIISIDGNGATCSRVVNALRSRSVLLKFSSPNQLYYFRGLEPWCHYVSVDTISDIEGAIDQDLGHQSGFDRIADNANDFARRFLSFDSVHRYGAKLLMHYARHVGDDTQPPALEGTVEIVRRTYLTLAAHLSDIGDMPSDLSGWVSSPNVRCPVEGISIEPCEFLQGDDLYYRCYVSNGQWTVWCQLGAYCGTKGASLAIFGLELRLSTVAAQRLRLNAVIMFSDGSTGVITGEGGQYVSSVAFTVNAIRIGLDILRS